MNEQVCLCGEINARHCPVHSEGEMVKFEDGTKIKVGDLRDTAVKERDELKAKLQTATEALRFYAKCENWEVSAIDELCTVKTKLTKDKESFGEVSKPGEASKLVVYGGKRARAALQKIEGEK